MKSCGECTLCCKLLGVPELNKPAGTRCSLVQLGIEPGTTAGCGDYANRPQTCRDFACLWVQDDRGAFTDDYRPDRLKAVLSVTLDSDKLVCYIDPRMPDVWKTGRLSRLIERMRQHMTVIVVCGDKRVILGS